MSAPMPCALGKMLPDSGHVERVKRMGWVNERLLIVSVDDRRLTEIERCVVEQIGNKLYSQKGMTR